MRPRTNGDDCVRATLKFSNCEVPMTRFHTIVVHLAESFILACLSLSSDKKKSALRQNMGCFHMVFLVATVTYEVTFMKSTFLSSYWCFKFHRVQNLSGLSVKNRALKIASNKAEKVDVVVVLKILVLEFSLTGPYLLWVVLRISRFSSYRGKQSYQFFKLQTSQTRL